MHVAFYAPFYAPFLYTPKQTLDAPSIHDNPPPGNQANEPEKGEDQDGNEKQLRVMQEWEGVVAQERNVGVVDQGGEVERVSEEGGEEIARAAGEEWEEEELDHVEVQVEREKGAVGDLGRLR